MRIKIFWGATILAIFMMVSYSESDKAVIMDGTWVIFDHLNFTQADTQIDRREIMEKRYGMSMKDIEAKFEARSKYIKNAKKRIDKLKEKLSGTSVVPTSITDRVSTAESDIATMQENQVNMKLSIENKCKELDRLFDPDEHCCVTDFALLCVTTTVISGNTDYAFPTSHAAGECPTCPTKLWTLFPHISSRK